MDDAAGPPTREPAEPVAPQPVAPSRSDRTALIAQGAASLATWSLRAVSIALGGVLLGLIIGRIWVVLLPVALAIIVSTLLAPVAGLLRRHRWPPALAAGLVVLVGVAALVGIIALITPPIIDQATEFGSSVSGGLTKVENWLTGPPLNLDDSQIRAATDAIQNKITSNATTIAGGVISGVTTVGSILITLLLVLVLTFFFVKDGDRFLPWLRRTTGQRAGVHLDAVLRRVWKAVGGFIRIQALVSLIDAVLIGVGIVIVGVPLALPLAVLTFLGGFIPIVGAVTAGALAVLVALVTGGLTKALIVLAIILFVQQLEGNVLQPILQSRSLSVHPAIILLAVTGGGSLFGIIGAFLAVPATAAAAEVLRYLGEHLDTRTQDADPEDEPALK